MRRPPTGATALVCALVLTLSAAAATAAPRSPASGPLDRDYAAYSRNIIPSGQLGAVPVPAGADRQAKMYDALTPLFDEVSPADLLRTFKDARFGVGSAGPGRVQRVPRKGVRIVRDRFSVPHITASTYEGGIWAAGWVMAADRGLLLQQARYNSRVAAIDVPGLPALPLISGLRSFVPSAQTEAVLARQTGVLRSYGRKGRRLLRDIDVYLAGINAYLRASKSASPPLTRNDIYAINALKGQFLGQGGGDEARRTQFLTTLQARLGATAGRSLFDDLRQHDDPEQPASIDARAPYAPLTASTAGNVLIDPGSYQATPAATLPTAARTAPASATASNVLMIGRGQSANRLPLMVGGPQIGYYYPGLTLEMDMHAPGLVWRGSTAAPFPGYLLIGRGPDFATTLTSAGADIVDQYAETLCDGSDTRYLYRGTCTEMGVFDAGVLKGTGGQPDQRVGFRTTVHGPVTGYATVGGAKVAISSKRSSYGRDTVDQLFFQDLSNGTVRDPRSFFRAAAQTPQTFNAFYLDHRHIAAYTTGRLPLRPADVDPGLLTRGDGSREWTGFLADSRHPQQADPRRGRIVNWNNNMARGFGAADSEWMRAGAIGRVDLLNRNLGRLAVRGKQTYASVTAAMNAAATQDVRAIDTVPLLARLLAAAPAPSPRAQRMLDLMVAWNRAGGSRLDRNLDGRIDDPGAAVMDGAWDAIADAAMGPILAPDLAQLATLAPRFDLPPAGQYGGWHQYMAKDLRRLLGDRVRGPFATRLCGAGDRSACQAAVWAAIDGAGARIAAAQGSEDPAAWRADARRERIGFAPGLLKTTMRYANRPSGFQQIVAFKGHR